MDIVLRNSEHILRLAENPLNLFPLPEISTGWANRAFHPKSEIEKDKIRQDAEAETLLKNRNPTHSGLVRFFQRVCAQ